MSQTPNDPTRDLVEDYALDQLDGAERAAFEARLNVDVRLQAELAATLETLGALALSTPVALTPALKQRVMSRIAGGTPHEESQVLPFVAPVRRSRTTLYLGAALAASLMLIARLTFDLRASEREVATARLLATTGAHTAAQRDSLIAQLTDPATETVTLAATGEAKPIIRAYINHARRSVTLSAAQLETLPAGRAYQLWFIVGSKAVPSVTFTSDSSGHALVREIAMPAGAVAATAITEEPVGGSPAPTSKVIFVGKLATE